MARPNVFRLGELAVHPYFAQVFSLCREISAQKGFAGVYVVGGFVRDLLLKLPNFDIDIAVEGDAIRFASFLAAKLNGQVRAHHRFGTAVVLLPKDVLTKTEEVPSFFHSSHESFHLDVISTRREVYEYPAALPRIELASLREDLFRRDFTVNALAMSLREEDFGTVIDYFKGQHDIEKKCIRVLHENSFVDDPTRIFRAIRYENRYIFRMDEKTETLARKSIEAHLPSELSGDRLREELIALLSEKEISWSLKRLDALGLAYELCPGLSAGQTTVSLINKIDEIIQELGLCSEVMPWHLRLMALARSLSMSELEQWLGHLKLTRIDSEIVRQGIAQAPLIARELVAEEMGDKEIYQILRKFSPQTLLFALAGLQNSPLEQTEVQLLDSMGRNWEETRRLAVQRIVLYLSELRQRKLNINGSDLLDLGMKSGPRLGQILEKLQEMRVEEIINGRESELEAARSLVLKEMQ